METSHWTSSNMDSVPLHSSSRLWDLDFQMKCKIYFHLKRGLWTTEFFFSTAQVRRFWCCLWFRSGLVALFLKTSELGDSWCTDSSFRPLIVKLSQVFESALLDSILKLAVIPVACAPFPTQILPSSQLCIQYALIQHSVNSHTFQRWPSVTYPLCGGHECSSSGSLPTQQSSPLLWFQRTRDTRNLYCRDGHLLKLKCKYSNILRYWFWLSWAVISNHQN